MNDILRRVMDAIHDAEPGGYEAQARAAIALMRQPTPRMLAAAEELDDGWGHTVARSIATDVWHAMIDAAQESDT